MRFNSLWRRSAKRGKESARMPIERALRRRRVPCLGREPSTSQRVRTVAAISPAPRRTVVCEITRRAKGVSIETTIEELAPYMRGWRSYFGFCETPTVLLYLTRWVRLRLRAALWRQWKIPRRRRRAALLKLGFPRVWPATRQAAGVALGLSPEPRLSLWGFLMRSSNPSDFRLWSTSAA